MSYKKQKTEAKMYSQVDYVESKLISSDYGSIHTVTQRMQHVDARAFLTWTSCFGGIPYKEYA